MIHGLHLPFFVLQSRGEKGGQGMCHVGAICTEFFREKIKERPRGKPEHGWEVNIKMGPKENTV